MSQNRPMMKGKTDYVKSAQITAVNTLLFHLAAMNNGAGVIWVQIWDVAQAADIGSVETVPDWEMQLGPNNIMALPFHKEGWQMGHGLYVRAVTATGGSSLISGNNMKLTYQYDAPWPLS